MAGKPDPLQQQSLVVIVLTTSRPDPSHRGSRVVNALSGRLPFPVKEATNSASALQTAWGPPRQRWSRMLRRCLHPSRPGAAPEHRVHRRNSSIPAHAT
jgi:hypothetical protein